IELHAPADCPRYCGRYIEGIDPSARTPEWMRERLRRGGIRPISLLVDVTQYAMLELGQPMHAFDAAKLKGPVGVRRAYPGETLKLLDEREVTLDPEFLLITDADRAVALAGVMGGFDTRVTETTRGVFLEAAHFAPAAIAWRARKLNMGTDAAHRFERGVDPELPRVALERATALILQVAGGKPGPILEAASPHLPRRASIVLRRTRIPRVLGIEIADEEVARILDTLDMRIEAQPDGWRVTPPSRRFDIEREEDLIEEVARMHGYDNIPSHLPAGEPPAPERDETRLPLSALQAQLAARDYHEAICYAFVDAEWLRTWQLDEQAIPLANPLSAELGVMRTSLLPGLVSAFRAICVASSRACGCSNQATFSHAAAMAHRSKPRWLQRLFAGPTKQNSGANVRARRISSTSRAIWNRCWRCRAMRVRGASIARRCRRGCIPAAAHACCATAGRRVFSARCTRTCRVRWIWMKTSTSSRSGRKPWPCGRSRGHMACRGFLRYDGISRLSCRAQLPGARSKQHCARPWRRFWYGFSFSMCTPAR